MKRLIGTIIGAALLLLPLSCSSFERTTFQTLSATQATLNSSQALYETGCPAPAGVTGCIPHDQIAFTAITKAKAADVLAVNAMVVYEQEKATSSSASVLLAQEQVVLSELAQIPSLLVAINTLKQ
jgi:hypothetical protein